MPRRHRHQNRARTATSAAAVTAVLTLLGPTTAVAAPVSSDGASYRTEIEHSTRGDGAARATARATSSGRVVVQTLARGTRGQRPAVARAVASVSEGYALTAGTYRVRLTYAGVTSRRRDGGPASTAAVRRRSVVTFTAADGAGASGERRVQSVPRRGSATTVVEVDVFPGTRGRLEVVAELYARSASRRPRDRAVAAATVRDVRITVTSVG